MIVIRDKLRAALILPDSTMSNQKIIELIIW